MTKTSNSQHEIKMTVDPFEELLSKHGFIPSPSVVVPKTMAELQNAGAINSTNSVNNKVKNWISGKENNIRSLLASLDSILWEGAGKWEQPFMSELLHPAQVKKWYKKAILIVHPDKQTGTSNQELALAVFTELNAAWTAYLSTSSNL